MPPKEGTPEYRSMRQEWKHYIRNCKKRNIFWAVSVELFAELTSANCHYCGRAPAQKSRDYIYNGVDRLNSKQGYVPENVVPCCKECNYIKGKNLTPEEMKVIAEALKAFRKNRMG